MNKRLVILTMLLMCCIGVSFSQPPLQQKLKFYVQMRLGLKIETEKTINLHEGKSVYEYLNVVPGKSYGIVAFSEDDQVYDMDIFIYDAKSGELIERDEGEKNYAILEFTAKRKQKLRIIIKNFDSRYRGKTYKCHYFIAN